MNVDPGFEALYEREFVSVYRAAFLLCGAGRGQRTGELHDLRHLLRNGGLATISVTATPLAAPPLRRSRRRPEEAKGLGLGVAASSCAGSTGRERGSRAGSAVRRHTMTTP